MFYFYDKKYNIKPLYHHEASQIHNIEAISYNLKIEKEDSDKQLKTNQNNVKNKSLASTHERTHYDFIAQDVRKIYPELVYEDDFGELGIDYIGFIPILLSELKHQKATIDSLRKEILNMKLKSNATPFLVENKRGILYQNKPNPFKVLTSISYEIYDISKSSHINVYNLNGKKIKSYSLPQKNEGSIEFESYNLKPGAYVYSLIVDDVIVDSKMMVISQ